MTIWTNWSIFLVLVTAGNAFGTTPFNATLLPATIEPGERAVLEFSLDVSTLADSVPQGARPDWAEISDQLLLQVGAINLLASKQERTDSVTVWRYEFTSYDVGAISIPPVTATWGPFTFSSDRMTVNVISSRSETDQDPRPDAGPVPEKSPWLWIALGVALVLLVVALFRHKLSALWSSWWAKLPSVEPSMPLQSPQEWLRLQLARLESECQTKSRPIATLLSDWTQVVRHYTEQRLRTTARSWTLSEYGPRIGNVSDFHPYATLLADAQAEIYSENYNYSTEEQYLRLQDRIRRSREAI